MQGRSSASRSESRAATRPNCSSPPRPKSSWRASSTRRNAWKKGPFWEYHGHYHEYGAGFSVEFLRVTCRSGALFQVVLPGLFREHILLGGVSIAAVLERQLRALAPNVSAVAVPETAAGRTAAVVALRQARPGQARQLMMAAFSAVPLIKQVTVVDEDVDPWDAAHVEWARMVRSRPERDLLVVPAARTDRSEPLSVDGVVGKLGVDATARAADRPAGPELAKIPAGSVQLAARLLAEDATDAAALTSHPWSSRGPCRLMQEYGARVGYC